MSVLAEVVAQRLCIGCGVCVAVCPQSRLTVDWNHRGELAARALVGGQCAQGCRRCMKACPFGDARPDETAIATELFEGEGVRSAEHLGRYRSLRVARVADEQLLSRCASGGIVTWLLERLLARDLVDAVVCVNGRSDPDSCDPLFEYAVFRTPDEVRSASSSAYYPVTLASVLDSVLDGSDRFVVVGLPCFVKAVRRLQRAMPALRNRTIVCIGLTCGQAKSRFFTDYTARVARPQGGTHVTGVYYRRKPERGDAGDFSFEFAWDDGESRSLRWSEGIGDAWSLRLFTPRACGYCDDIFAETADLSVMDAWQQPWRSDPRGTSFVIARSELGETIMGGGEGLGLNEPVEPDVVLRSQGAAVRDKSAGIAIRSSMERNEPWRVPEKRPITQTHAGMREQFVWRAAETARRASAAAWSRRGSVVDVQGATRSARWSHKVARSVATTLDRARGVAGAAVRSVSRRARA